MMKTNLAIRNLWRCTLLAALLGTAAGCAITPATNVHQPMSARPEHPVPLDTSGSIFRASYSTQASRYTPMFEDRRARYVGDTIIVTLNEKNNAIKKSDSSIDRQSGVSLTAPMFTGVPVMPLMNMTAEGGSSNTFSGKGGSGSNNVFTGTIAVTVIEVLPNGNLLVSGEKQIGINQGQEFIRFSGVVNPVMIGNNSTIWSGQVADARIEYRANGYVDEAQTMGWFSRALMTISPF